MDCNSFPLLFLPPLHPSQPVCFISQMLRCYKMREGIIEIFAPWACKCLNSFHFCSAYLFFNKYLNTFMCQALISCECAASFKSLKSPWRWWLLSLHCTCDETETFRKVRKIFENHKTMKCWSWDLNHKPWLSSLVLQKRTCI